MRIAVTFLDRAGGISQCTLELVRVLCRHADLTCYLTAQNDLLDEFRALPCVVKTFDWNRGIWNLFSAMLTKRDPTGVATAINEDAPDLVIDTGSWWWRGVVWRHLKPGFPIAEMVHDVTPHPGPMALLYELHRVFYPSPADIIVAMSDYCYGQLARKYPNKVKLLSRHGIIMPSAEVSADATASLRKRMLFFGRIDKYKGLDRLVDAFAVAKSSDPDLELDIVGRGEISRALAQRIVGLGIGLRNEFVPNEEIPHIARAHGVIVLPYTSATQSGVAAVALANGIPCIASRVGALPEQIIDGANGLVVSPGQPRELAAAMLRIAGDRDTARRMSAEATRIGTELYSWEKIGRDLLRDLREYLGAKQ